jgi:hypothetical protein
MSVRVDESWSSGGHEHWDHRTASARRGLSARRRGPHCRLGQGQRSGGSSLRLRARGRRPRQRAIESQNAEAGSKALVRCGRATAASSWSVLETVWPPSLTLAPLLQYSGFQSCEGIEYCLGVLLNLQAKLAVVMYRHLDRQVLVYDGRRPRSRACRALPAPTGSAWETARPTRRSAAPLPPRAMRGLGAMVSAPSRFPLNHV